MDLLLAKCALLAAWLVVCAVIGWRFPRLLDEPQPTGSGRQART